MAMNKSVVLGCVAVLWSAMGCATVSAADIDPGFYVGVGVGEATVELDDVDFDDSDGAFKLFGGYRFNPYFGVELAYFDGGTAQDGQAGFPGTVEIETTGVNLSAIVTAPFGDDFSIFAKLGYASLDFEVAANVFGMRIPVDDDTEEELSFGAGASLAVNESFSLRAEYEAFDFEDADVSQVMLSAVFRF
jgi:OmpA-OmpF porin, OOP family